MKKFHIQNLQKKCGKTSEPLLHTKRMAVVGCYLFLMRKIVLFLAEKTSVLFYRMYSFGGKHLESCVFDEEFKTHVEEEQSNMYTDYSDTYTSKEEKERADNYLNYDITLEETEAVLQRLQNGKSPGPDNIFTDMLKSAGEEMTKAIHTLFQMSWETSKVPDEWKEAEVKFLRKSGKKSYHDASSYRPISLTSCLCKCLERLITHRLYGFVEHFGLLDDEQEGFRRFRGTTDALLRLTQSIFNGFNKKEHTAALFIDLEKAYDSVWREGLMFKLKKLGLSGRVWKWINSFLVDRQAMISMGGNKGPHFATNIGLPQGSVLAPLLFNLFIRDMFDGINCQCVKFADDGTIWKNGNNVTEILSFLEVDLKVILQWAKKWRMKISLSKTEFVFSHWMSVQLNRQECTTLQLITRQLCTTKIRKS
ncbi:MAG: reverse transcriptase family protein [Candidatus Thiodiazotropha sp.]